MLLTLLLSFIRRKGASAGLSRTAVARIFALSCVLSSGLFLPACQIMYDESYRLPGTGQEPVYAGVGQVEYDSVQYLAESASTLAYEASQAASEASAAEDQDAAERAAKAAEAASASAAEAARAARMLKTQASAPPPPPAKKSFLGIRYDDSSAKFRQARAACPTEDPCAVPSYSELRKAKADAIMAAEVKAKGGDTQVKPDGSSSDPTEVKFVASPGALGINLLAEENLNSFDGTPHALVLKIYHLEDRTFFDQLASNSEGVRKLLGDDVTDASIKAVRRMFIQPGTHSILNIERSENGRYVGIVAGFDNMDPSRVVSVSSYGIGRYKKKAGVLSKSQDMFSPLPLNLMVHLGSDGMSVSETEELVDNYAQSKVLSGAPSATRGNGEVTYDASRYNSPVRFGNECESGGVVSTYDPNCGTCP